MHDISLRGGTYALLALMSGFAGCAQMGKDPDKISVGSRPAGADVYVMGERVGVTPLAVDLSAVFPPVYAPEKRALYGTVELRKPGCKNSVNAVTTKAIAKGIDVGLECEGATAAEPVTGKPVTSTDAPQKTDVEARLRKVRELREKGLISEQEEQAVRQRILHEL